MDYKNKIKKKYIRGVRVSRLYFTNAVLKQAMKFSSAIVPSFGVGQTLRAPWCLCPQNKLNNSIIKSSWTSSFVWGICCKRFRKIFFEFFATVVGKCKYIWQQNQQIWFENVFNTRWRRRRRWRFYIEMSCWLGEDNVIADWTRSFSQLQNQALGKNLNEIMKGSMADFWIC